MTALSVYYFFVGLVVINKPYGISFAGHAKSVKDKQKPVFVKETVISSGVSSKYYTLINVLPYICKELGYEKLHIGRVPEKLVRFNCVHYS